MSRAQRTDEAVTIALQVLDALAAAHDAGVVHRDIKPSNLIRLRDGRIKVADFGIARLRGTALLHTEAGQVLCTPGYAAPEQIRGEEVDARSDLFSLAMVLYETLAGKLPFSAKSPLELASKVLQETPAPLRSVRPDLSPAVESVLARALAKERSSRWPSAREMASALRAAVASPFGTATVAAAAAPSRREPGKEGSLNGAQGHETRPVYRGVPSKLPSALAHLVTSWPAKSLGPQRTDRLLARLLDRPLHAPPFSGGVVIGERLLLVHEGAVVGAIGHRTGTWGNRIAEELDEEAPAQLHPVPDGLPAGTVEVLAGLLGTTRVLQAGLDASIVSLPGLVEKLAREEFDGALHLRRGADEGRVVLVGGSTVLAFYSDQNGKADPADTWNGWVGDPALSLDVEEVSSPPLDLTWRIRLRDLQLVCRLAGAGTSGRRSSGGATRRLSRLAERLEPEKPAVELRPAARPEDAPDGWQRDPACRLLEWLLVQARTCFTDTKLAGRWTYLADWLPLVRRARLHADLSEGDGPPARRFDFATYDEEGKILHLGRRFANLTPAGFRGALDLVVEAKEARRESGDIGGVVFAAPQFSREVVAAYLETVEGATGGFSRLQESVTGHAGFVRMGPRRGFHLLLVEEGEGDFTPIGI